MIESGFPTPTGFALLGLHDQRQLELELPVYDALYAWAESQVGAA